MVGQNQRHQVQNQVSSNQSREIFAFLSMASSITTDAISDAGSSNDSMTTRSTKKRGRSKPESERNEKAQA